MKSFRFPIIVPVSIALLALLSLRYFGIARAQPKSIGYATARTPVLIELFTSEGCSDCPRAVGKTGPVPAITQRRADRPQRTR
jgi:hypothetical protein